MKKQIVIGVGGVARAGKNLLCDLLIKQLKIRFNLNAKQYALAYELKLDCKPFLQEKFNIDVFTENTEEKKIFRNMLVWYGDVKRKQTNGRYWIEKLESRIDEEFKNNPKLDIAIVSDIRYDYYPKDEVDWVVKEKNGVFIHVSKYTYAFPTNGRNIKISGDNIKIFTDPANEHEMLNDPKLKKKADYLLEWEDVNYSSNNSMSYTDLLENKYLNESVIECLQSIQRKIIH